MLANLDRLRAGEPWAWRSQSLDDAGLYTEHMLARYATDRSLPCVIRSGDRIVGAASLAFDTYLGTASLGYWIDAGMEGRGVVRRAATALLSVAQARGGARVEIRTAVGNARSRGLAERLGFTHEGTLHSEMPLRESRVDVALYGLVF